MTSRPLRALDLCLVAAGGAVGAVARWAVAVVTPETLVAWDVVAINVVGCFALGALPVVPAVRRSHRLTVALGPGLLGGFTTVSAWSDDVRRLVADGQPALAALLLGVTLGAGLLAARLGRLASHRPEPEDAVT